MMYFLNNLYLRIILWGFFYWFASDSYGQSNIEADSIQIAYNKTSSVIFPTVIKSVDRGSRDILAQKAKGVGNVLQLKAGRENFPETNLTVITADGVLHHFTVKYAVSPASQALDMSGNIYQPTSPLIFQTDMTETDLEKYSEEILNSKRAINVKESKYKIKFSLLGIFIKDDVMFYHVRIRNTSNINYDVDFLKFYVRDRARIKRTASQEVEVKPIYVYGNDEKVKGNSETDIVYALEKFTIPESKYLDVELFEQNGGRHFDLPIKNKLIVNAQLLQ